MRNTGRQETDLIQQQRCKGAKIPKRQSLAHSRTWPNFEKALACVAAPLWNSPTPLQFNRLRFLNSCVPYSQITSTLAHDLAYSIWMRTLHAYMLRQVLATLTMTVGVFTFVLLMVNALK